MLKLILVKDNLICFEIIPRTHLRNYIFNAMQIFVEKYDSSIKMNNSVVSVDCPNRQTAEVIAEAIRSSSNYFIID